MHFEYCCCCMQLALSKILLEQNKTNPKNFFKVYFYTTQEIVRNIQLCMMQQKSKVQVNLFLD